MIENDSEKTILISNKLKFKINNTGILSVLLPCLIGSLTYSVLVYFHFNNKGGFYITLIDVLLICLLLLFSSVIIAIPIVFYIRFSVLNYLVDKKLLNKLNTLYLIYSTMLYLLFSYLMSNYTESLELTLTYIISGFISLNLYLSKIKRKDL